ncbi:Repetin [Streptomyces sp. NBC_00237]|uniref:Repetin n=1 Tax=Streptomyces sp. NBC_00237 TaxID=2975687 RepID=UPI0022520677|nr:Repetin [Streptomyces sp. NBC_00237]MCX5202606.1 Repetin [Streptomyces sp. NBC_00237]
MTSIATRRTRFAALSAALLITAGAAGTATASGPEAQAPAQAGQTASKAGQTAPREAAALTGRAQLDRPGHEITFAFDAHLASGGMPDQAKGGLSIRHRWPNGTVQWAEVTVDCLVTGGKVAVVSGTVRKSNIEGQRNKRVGITVDDRPEGDRLGYSWLLNGTVKEQPRGLPKCLGSAPIEKVDARTGDFDVLPLELG